MAIEDALTALAEHAADVIPRLDAARRRELRNLITEIGGEDHTGAVIRITQLLVGTLPPEHPVRRALAQGYLYSSAPPDWSAIRAELIAEIMADSFYAEPDADAKHDPPGLAAHGAETAEDVRPGGTGTTAGILGDGADTAADTVADTVADTPAATAAATASATPEGILAAVTDRLLRAPALTEDEVRLRGADPADPALLRLDRPGGGRQWPSFQFGPDGALLPVVQIVNTLLGAEADPLGVADWWLGANPWLDGQPSDLIGHIPDELVLRAAHAVIEEV
jgi:hypothetical protein